MINISSNFSQKLNENPSFETLKNRKPIIDYSVSSFHQFDFNTWESEENIKLVRANKRNVENAEEFLRNTLEIFGQKRTNYTSIQKITDDAFNEIIKEIVHDFKYNLNLSEEFVDAIKLSDEWDRKAVLLETASEYIYIEWYTTA